ncbi:MAG: RelA/SpoT family protein [Tannerellaceae bacterium]|jgi:GTP pyrophosphokinase|nr:RelA/SpoT family protein [Tannerellaceae bacterium]
MDEIQVTRTPEEEERMIKEEFDSLLNEYKNSNHRGKTEIITTAFNFAKEAHAGVKRQNGDPYIMHPLAVARIACHEMGLGSTSICAALLHDVVEDTDYGEEDIRNMFGDKIAQIVMGLTKIIPNVGNASPQAENFRKLLLTGSEDIRVLLIKIADRLHNMRTLEHMRPDQQFRNTGETLANYVPLAHRLGFFEIKSQLEDLCFKYEQPEAYKTIQEQLAAKETSHIQLFEAFAAPIREELDKLAGVEFQSYTMVLRIKSAYSIWKKMQTKKIGFNDVYDKYAGRIVFDPWPNISATDEKHLCWKIYTTVTDQHRLNPDRIRDWVSNPKSNGYQSLHVTVMMEGPGKWFEVQIRSKRMHEIAEKGVAAHWRYKASDVKENKEIEKGILAIANILEKSGSDPNALDLLDTIKLNLAEPDILVFTPKGDIINLPQGATVLDFAYSLHSNIGNKCIGAKVNKALAPLSYKLASADQVDILTSQSQEAQEEWFNYAITLNAKTKIQASIERRWKEDARIGEEMVLKAFQKANLETDSSKIDKLANYCNYRQRKDFYHALGTGKTTLPEKIKKIVKSKRSKTNPSDSSLPNQPKKIDKSKIFILKEDDLNTGYKPATCCKPIPGDDAFGFIDDDGKTVIVHKHACLCSPRLKSNSANRVLAIKWKNHKVALFEVTITLKGIDSSGVLHEMTKIISDEFNVNIQELFVKAEDGVFNGRIKLKVHDTNDINKLVKRLSKINNIKAVSRTDD